MGSARIAPPFRRTRVRFSVRLNSGTKIKRGSFFAGPRGLDLQFLLSAIRCLHTAHMIPKNERERYDKLKSTINRYRTLYHVYDKEEISQAVLDSLKHELVEIEEKYPEIIAPDSPSQRVAGKPLPGFKKVRHKVAQWSFNDAFSPEEMREFDARIKSLLSPGGKPLHPSYVCELKIEGLKIVLTYEKGLLKTAATRGDGT